MINSTEAEARILHAAQEEFEAKGYSGARMQAIADAAGISKASLHYYFRSKDKLFEKIFEQAIEEYLPIIQTWSDDSLDWEEKVRKFSAELFRFIKNGKMLFIIREINRNPELLSARLKHKKKPNPLVAYFENLIEQGTIRKTDARLLYIFLNSLCCFPVVNKEMFEKALRMTSKEYEDLMQQYARFAADFFINAIKK
jgi:TetR/AcrR family transcriptional regulator